MLTFKKPFNLTCTLLPLLFCLFDSSVVLAQHSYGDGSGALSHYPCVWPALDSVQAYLPEVFSKSSGGVLLFFTIDNSGIAGVSDYILFVEKGFNMSDSIFNIMINSLEPIDISNCERLANNSWFVIPIAIYNPAWDSWHQGLPSIFRKDSYALDAMRTLLRFNPQNVLPTYFGFRVNRPLGCPYPSCE